MSGGKQTSPLLPALLVWAEACAAQIGRCGRPLNASGRRLAATVGVWRPDMIRVHTVSCLPWPDDDRLQRAGLASGLLGEGGTGMTLGYAVVVRSEALSARLLAHEFRHVRQCEDAGDMAAFLAGYIAELEQFGYRMAPSEVDARAAETLAAAFEGMALLR